VIDDDGHRDSGDVVRRERRPVPVVQDQVPNVALIEEGARGLGPFSRVDRDHRHGPVGVLLREIDQVRELRTARPSAVPPEADQRYPSPEIVEGDDIAAPVGEREGRGGFDARVPAFDEEPVDVGGGAVSVDEPLP
jgi:hypothetical protein